MPPKFTTAPHLFYYSKGYHSGQILNEWLAWIEAMAPFGSVLGLTSQPHCLGRNEAMIPALKALTAYRSRGCVSLNDRELEAQLFSSLQALERDVVDRIGPTPLRHKLSDLIVQMRAEVWAFDQSKDSS